MKLHIFESTYHDLRCVKALAIIPKSIKKGIPRKFQKTWSMKTVAPQFTIQEMTPGIQAEAKRWEQKIMARIKQISDSTNTTTPSDTPPIQPISDQPSAPSG